MTNSPQPIVIQSPYIALGQFLKLADIIASGGEAKAYLATEEVIIDGVIDQRRGRKLYPGTIVETSGKTFIVVEP